MSWNQQLQQNARRAKDLLPYLPLTAEEQAGMDRVLDQFPMSVTEYYLSLIDWNDPEDPIRKMSIPSVLETDLSGSFDTSGEASNTVLNGLQHKYRETALILSTNQCAMYCRHCFRKRLVGLSEDEIAEQWSAMAKYVSKHTEISNVLVSGGDALLNSNERLTQLLYMLADIPHLDFIRMGSRIPVVFPQRITQDAELLDVLAEINQKKQLVLVTQYNHPKELTEESLASVKAVQKLGIPVKNQAVLLRGVNDDPDVLAALLRRLTREGVSPYYIFQCRPVSGVKNQFQVPLRRALQVVNAAKAAQNGLGKSFHYCMSHVSGKIEILGEWNGEMLFRYHEARDRTRLNRVFSRNVAESQTWLEEELILD